MFMKTQQLNSENQISLCHSGGMCPVLHVGDGSFVVSDEHQANPGSVRLNLEQARGLVAALQKLLPPVE